MPAASPVPTSDAAVDQTKDGVAEKEEEEPRWGRVLVAGGTRWLALGKKDKIEEGDLATPHKIRSLSNFRITSLYTSPSSFHLIAIDILGSAHFVGRNQTSCFGVPSAALYESDPNHDYKIRGKDLPGASEGNKVIYAATGRGNSVLVGSDGGVWSAGLNASGQCGHSTNLPELTAFSPIRGPWEKDPSTHIIQATCGLTFTLLLTNTGIVYACGSSEHGQLGNGKTGERIVTGNRLAWDLQEVPRAIPQFSPKKIVKIASGQQHSLAMDEDGFVWAWGFAGYSRLGFGNQVDKLVPTMVPQFSGGNPLSRASNVHCGPTCSIVVDRQLMYQMCGKWKTTGDGGSGSPYTTFKYIQDIMHCKVIDASSGGNGHFLITPADEGEVMTIGFGQGCTNAELGLGVGEPKNATKPVRIVPLNHMSVFGVAAAAFTTFFLVEPTLGEPFEDLPRWPEVQDSEDVCLMCDETLDDVMPMECEKCESPYHPQCLDPPLDAVPEGEWFCPACVKEAEATEDLIPIPESVGDAAAGGKGKGKGKGKAAPVKAGSKRKAEPEPKKAAKKRR